MLRPILIAVHAIYLIGIVLLMIKEPDEYRAPALIPAAILLLIVYGLMKAKRWVVVPALISALVAIMFAALFLMGSVGWPQNKITMYAFTCLLFFVLEVIVIWHAIKEY